VIALSDRADDDQARHAAARKIYNALAAGTTWRLQQVPGRVGRRRHCDGSGTARCSEPNLGVVLSVPVTLRTVSGQVDFPLVQIPGLAGLLQRVHRAAGFLRTENRAVPAAAADGLHCPFV
jgi:hypothetical protein